MSSRAASRVSLIAVATFFASAQTQTTVRVDVDFVPIDATVTDASGKPVTGLNASDFEIFAGGQPQTVTQCAWIPHPRIEPHRPPDIRIAEGLFIAPPFIARPPDPAAVIQSTAIVVDDLGISGESLPFVRDAIARFARQQIDAANPAALVRTGSAAATPFFTADPRLIAAAAGMLAFRIAGRTGLASAPSLQGPVGVFTDIEPRERQIDSALHALGVIEQVIVQLAPLPGRHRILLFSENLPGPEIADRALSELRDEYRRIAEAAARSSVIIDAVEPRGAIGAAPDAGDEFIRTPVSAMRDWEARRVRDVEVSENGLFMLTRDTGGMFIRNANGASAALDRLAATDAGYYSLGFDYPPSSPTRFHELKVRVTRPGMTVRARAGFFDNPVKSASVGNDALVSALRSPFPSRGIGVELTPLFSSDAPQKYFITSLIHVATPTGAAALRIREEVSNADGEPVAGAQADIPVRLPADKDERGYVVRHQIAKPGAYLVRVAVEDSAANHVGSASRVIVIPEIGPETLALSSILLEPRTQSTSTPPPEGISGIPASEAFRVFRPGSKLTYGCIVFNGKRRRLEVQTRLFHGSEQVYSSALAPFSLAGQPDPKRLTGAWRLNLGSRLHPGTYTLQLIVVDRERPKRAATQSVDFTIE